MLSFVRRLLTGTVARATRPARRPPYRPTLEVLEDRRLLSLLAGEFHVNQARLDNQFDSDNASDRLGRTVIVWTDEDRDSADPDDHDIVWRSFDAPKPFALADPLVDEVRVADNNNFNDFDPAVAVSRQSGDAIIVWTRESKTNGTLDIMGQHFNLVTGAAKLGSGNPFVIAGTATHDESEADVAVSPLNGEFVVSYTVNLVGSNRTNITAKRYVALTTVPLQTINVAASALNERDSSVAYSQATRFAIAWTEGPVTSSVLDNVRIKRFNSSGVLLSNLLVAGTTLDEDSPSVGADAAGNFVIAWRQQNVAAQGGSNIRVRKLQFNGVLGPVFNVAFTPAFEANPSVAVDPVSGNFVVAYESKSATQSNFHVLVTEFLGNGTKKGTFDCGTDLFGLSQPAVSFGNGFYTVSYTKIGDVTDPDTGIFGRRGQISV